MTGFGVFEGWKATTDLEDLPKDLTQFLNSLPNRSEIDLKYRFWGRTC